MIDKINTKPTQQNNTHITPKIEYLVFITFLIRFWHHRHHQPL